MSFTRVVFPLLLAASRMVDTGRFSPVFGRFLTRSSFVVSKSFLAGSRRLLMYSALILFVSACNSEQGLDKGKFTELNRAAQDLKTAITSGGSCNVPDALVERLASGTAALKDKTASKLERDLLTAYTDLLAITRDALHLCRSRNHLTDFQFVPKGRIYVTQDLDPIIEKYGLSTEKHLYKPTGAYMKSISGDSIAVVWESAAAEIKFIENMINYN